MSDGVILLNDRLVFVPSFDSLDFDYDARPMYRSIEQTIMEGE